MSIDDSKSDYPILQSGTTPKHDAILTTLHRVDSTYAANFLASLRRTGYKGEVVFFVSWMNAASIASLRRQSITVVPFWFFCRSVKQRLAWPWPLWRWIFNSGVSQAFKEKLAHAVFHLFYRRHLLYLRFLRANRMKYDRVFLTDARDVFFQADPFAWNPPPGVHLFLEESTNRIGSSECHINWINSQFGPEALDQIKTDVVSCAGTVYGDIDGIMKYLSAMVDGTMQARSLEHPDGDQGIHNYLLYQNPLPEFIVHDNRHGPLMTLGVMKPEEIRMNPDGWVINDDGRIPAVLHQYDRHPEVEKTLHAHLQGSSQIDDDSRSP